MARVLVVDGSELSRRLLSDILGKDGHEVTGVEDGEEALTRLAGNPFDLVITDFMMPGMLGDELVQRIRGTTPDVPVMVISSYYDSELFRRVRQLAVARIINKPFSDGEILGAVRELLARRPAATPPGPAPAGPA